MICTSCSTLQTLPADLLWRPAALLCVLFQAHNGSSARNSAYMHLCSTRIAAELVCMTSYSATCKCLPSGSTRYACA